MALAKDETRWYGGYPNLSMVFRQQERLSPEWGASGIYGLTPVETPDGKTHLVGTVAKSGFIYDFTTRRTIYDFTAATGGSIGGVSGSFGLTGPITNGDTYDAVAFWRSPADKTAGQPGWYYFGGFISGPAQSGTTFSSLNKFTYLLRTRDLINWQVLVKDQSNNATSWKAEVTHLIPTEDHLYIPRGDASGSSNNLGLYRYDGTTVTQVTTEAAFKGVVYDDYFIYSVRGTSTRGVRNLITGTVGTSSLSAVPSVVGGTYAGPSVFQGSYAKSGGSLLQGAPDGYIQTDTAGAHKFVPLMIRSVDGFPRGLGWRAGAMEVAGGVVIHATILDPDGYDVASNGATRRNPQAYLLWIGPGGQAKVLDVGGHFSGMTVFGDQLYYGVTEDPACNRYTNYLFGNPALSSIAISDIKSKVVPYSFNVLLDGPTQGYVAGASGVGGMLGGVPTLGYRTGKMRVHSSAIATLTLHSWTSEAPARQIGSVELSAGAAQVIDLAPYMDGNTLGFKLSANALLDATLTFA